MWHVVVSRCAIQHSSSTPLRCTSGAEDVTVNRPTSDFKKSKTMAIPHRQFAASEVMWMHAPTTTSGRDSINREQHYRNRGIQSRTKKRRDGGHALGFVFVTVPASSSLPPSRHRSFFWRRANDTTHWHRERGTTD